MEENKTWTVVSFNKDQSVAAIPTTWITGTNECVWPPFTAEKTATSIRNHIEPNTCWPTFQITQFRDATYDDYARARAKTQKAEYTSDLATSCDEQTKRHRRLRVISSSDEDDEQSVLRAPPKLKISRASYKPPGKGIINESMNISQPIDEVAVIDISTPKTVPEFHSTPKTQLSDKTPCGFCKDTNEYVREILRQQFYIKNLVKDVLMNTQAQNQTLANAVLEDKADSIFKLFKLPLNSEGELMQFNIHLRDETNFKNAITEMCKLGGKSNYEFVKRCLAQLLSDSTAKKFSWLGRRDKQAFCKLETAKLLIEAAASCNKAQDDKQTETSIAVWLRRVGDRLKSVNRV